MRKLSIKTLIVLLSCSSCFKDITAPECDKISDCPADYIACHNSRCFKYDTGCGEKEPVSEDGCCSGLEIERSGDADCITFQAALNAKEISHPAVRKNDGMMFFNYRDKIDDQIYLAFVSSKGETLKEFPVGSGKYLFPPMLFNDRDVYSSYSEGIKIYDIDKKEQTGFILSSKAPDIPLTSSGSTVVWADENNSIYFYYPEQNKQKSFPMPDDLLPVIYSEKADAFVSASAKGMITGISNKANLLSASSLEPSFQFDAGSEIASQPVMNSLDLYVTLSSGIIFALSLSSGEPQKKWEVNLGGISSSPLLVDSSGILYGVRDDGKVFLIRETGGTGAVAGIRDLSENMTGASALITDRGRFLYYSPKSHAIQSFIAKVSGSNVEFSNGFSFNMNDQANSGFSMFQNRLIVPMNSGVIGMVSFEGLDSGSWIKSYGGLENRMNCH